MALRDRSERAPLQPAAHASALRVGDHPEVARMRAQVAMMRTAFGKLSGVSGAGGAGTVSVTEAFLARAVRDVPGLHPTGEISASEMSAVLDRCDSDCDNAVRGARVRRVCPASRAHVRREAPAKTTTGKARAL
jgi:hypothetical protein